MTFDKLYVLAKGGFCVYEGPPKALEFHLSKAEITCSQYQIPIEVLIRICSKTDGSAQRLSKILLKNKNELRYRCETEGRLSPGGISQKAIAFNLFHFWYILQRTVVSTFKYQWKTIIFQLLFFTLLGLCIPYLYNRNIGQPDSCLNTTATGTDINFLGNELLVQNQKFIFLAIICIQFLITAATVLVLSSGFTLFFNEHRNGI